MSLRKRRRQSGDYERTDKAESIVGFNDRHLANDRDEDGGDRPDDGDADAIIGKEPG